MNTAGKTIKKDPIKVKEELSNLYLHLDFSKFEYVNNTFKSIVICNIHKHSFEDSRKNILRTKSGGCRYCSNTGPNAKKTTEEFLQELRSKFDKELDFYDVSKISYSGATADIEITCPDHGYIKRPANYFINTEGPTPCPFCNREVKYLNQFDTLETFKDKFEKRYGQGCILFDRSSYSGSKLKTVFTCREGHDFSMRPNDLINKGRCPKCVNNGSSSYQIEIEEFLSEKVSYLISRAKLRNSKELDILLPEYDLAIEFNGLYWHRENAISKNAHLEKLNYCKTIGLKLIQIFEDEWIERKDIVKSRLINLINQSNKVPARKTIVKEVSIPNAKNFVDTYHIQGYVPSRINIGLYLHDDMVAIASFGDLRFNNEQKEHEYELLRFCSKGNVVGGFSKILSYFTKKYSPKRILSYSDKRWSEGNLYKKTGFTWTGESSPAESWCKNQVRLSRFQTMKHKLKSWPKYSDDKTAEQILIENGWYRVWDCGCDRWEMKFE